jgi:hypothetical protein
MLKRSVTQQVGIGRNGGADLPMGHFSIRKCIQFRIKVERFKQEVQWRKLSRSCDMVPTIEKVV